MVALIPALFYLGASSAAPPESAACDSSWDMEAWIPGSPRDGWCPTAPTSRGTIIEYWATWCIPCIEQIPHMTALARDHEDDFDLVWVAVDSLDAVETFLGRRGRFGPVAVDTDWSSAQAMGIDGIPTALVFDRQGTLRFAGHSATLTEAVLDEIASGAASAADPLVPSPAPVRPLMQATVVPSTAPVSELEWSPIHLTIRGQTIRGILSHGHQTSVPRVVVPDFLEQVRLDVRIAVPVDKPESLTPTLDIALETALDVEITVTTDRREVWILDATSFAGARLPHRSAPFNLTAEGISGHEDFEAFRRYLENELLEIVADGDVPPGVFAFDLAWRRGDRSSLENALAAQGMTLRRGITDVQIVRVQARVPDQRKWTPRPAVPDQRK